MLAIFLLARIGLAAESSVTIFGQELALGADATPKLISERVMPLFVREYARRMKLEATEAEVELLLAKAPELRKPEGSSGVADTFFRSLITHFKLNRELYRKHGGRVALSAFGFHLAKDAVVAELRSLEHTGELRIPDGRRTEFYEYLSKTPGDGVVTGAAAAAAFRDAPWEARARR